jgi:hypothetical protein
MELHVSSCARAYFWGDRANEIAIEMIQDSIVDVAVMHHNWTMS